MARMFVEIFGGEFVMSTRTDPCIAKENRIE